MIYKWFAQTETRKRILDPSLYNLIYFIKTNENKTKNKQKYKNATQNQKTTEKTNILYKTRKDVLIVV